MNAETFQDDQYRISFTAGANQRYHQRKASAWARLDRGIRIVVALLAVAGAVASFVATAYVASIVVACLAAVAAVTLNVLPVGDWEKTSVALYQRWTDLREEIDSLQFELSDKPGRHLVERLRKLDGKVHRICGAETCWDEALWTVCEAAERLSRGEDTGTISHDSATPVPV